MTIIIYILLILLLPAFFLVRKERKELAAVIALIALFLFVHRLFVTGQQTVSWDTMAWSLRLWSIKGVLQSGHLPGWNPYFNCGEPFYLYHYDMLWQWFLFVFLNYFWPIAPLTLFNLFFIFLFIFYNLGCYLFFQKIFEDKRVVLFCFAISLFATSFIMYFQEIALFYVSIYLPYLLYFFLEYAENKSYRNLIFIGGLVGMMSNCYLPQFPIIAFGVFLACYLAFMSKKCYSFQLDKETIVYTSAGVLLLLVIASPSMYVFSQLPDYVSPIRSGPPSAVPTYDVRVIGHHQEYSGILNLICLHNTRGIMFIGILPLILAVIGALKSNNRFHLVILGSTIVIFFVSLGANSFFYILFKCLPISSIIRQYLLFEIFAQMFIICLAGMGLEYILATRKERSVYLLILLLAISITVLLIRTLAEPDSCSLPAGMFPLFFCLSILAIYVLITYETRRSFYFFFTLFLLCSLSLQWYLGYRKFPQYRNSGDVLETNKLVTLLGKDPDFSWKEQRERFSVDGTKHLDRLIELLGIIRGEIEQFGHCFESSLEEASRYLHSYETCYIFQSQGYSPTLDRDSLHFCANFLEYPPPKPTKIARAILVALEPRLEKDSLLFDRILHGNNDLVEDPLHKFLSHFSSDLYELDYTLNDVFDTLLSGDMEVAEAKMKQIEGELADLQERLKNLCTALHQDAETDALSALEQGFGQEVARLHTVLQLTVRASKRLWSRGQITGISSRQRRNLILRILDLECVRLRELKEMVGGRTLHVDDAYKTHEPALRGHELVYWEPIGRELLINKRYYKLYPLFREGYFNYFGVSSPKLFVTTHFTILPEEKIPDEMENNYKQWNETTKTVYLPEHEINERSLTAWQNRKVVDDQRPICANPKAISYGPNHLRVYVNSPTEAFLVYLQNYDRDWHAYINNKETKIYRANYSFQAIRIKQGENYVDFRFKSPYKYFFIMHLLGVTITLTLMGRYFYNKGPG